MENSAKHTTSPWAARGWSMTGPTAAADYVASEAVRDALPEVFVRSVGQAEGIGKVAVCTVYGLSADEAEANARLLAAAPDLTAALRKITTEYVRTRAQQDGKKMGDDWSEYEDIVCVAAARAAIAAAGAA